MKKTIILKRICEHCSSPNLNNVHVKKQQVDAYKRGDPVDYISKDEPGAVLVTVCDDCKQLHYP